MATATAVRERGILFSDQMVRAILAGKKTVTRRIVKRQPPSEDAVRRIAGCGYGWLRCDDWKQPDRFRPVGPVWAVRNLFDTKDADLAIKCPYGAPGDRLWVRECWKRIPDSRPSGYWSNPALIGKNFWYRATDDLPTWGGAKWSPSILMPKAACRAFLEVVDTSLVPLHEITEDDAECEGFEWVSDDMTPLAGFVQLWDKINLDPRDADRTHSWEANDWVWRIEFRRVEREE